MAFVQKNSEKSKLSAPLAPKSKKNGGLARVAVFSDDISDEQDDVAMAWGQGFYDFAQALNCLSTAHFSHSLEGSVEDQFFVLREKNH